MSQTNQENSLADNSPPEGSHDAPSSNSDAPSKPRKALLRGFITLSEAEDEEDDMRIRLQYAEKRGEFYNEMKKKEEEIQSVVASHCGLTSPDLVHIPDMFDEKRISWIHGSFNICIPVSITQSGICPPTRMAFRVPLPYKAKTVQMFQFLRCADSGFLVDLVELEHSKRDTTYTSADTFYLDLLYLDLLASHDNRLRYQGNAVFGEDDPRRQAVDLVLTRASLAHFTDRSLRDGPFVMYLTDMHPSNIFVDKDWNIKHIIDLECACSLPLEHLLAPFWLTGKGVDQLTGPEYKRFEKRYRKLTNAIRHEETNVPLCYKNRMYSLAATMDRAWEQRHYWYLLVLRPPTGLFNIFREQLQPLYEEAPDGPSLSAAVSPFWTPGMGSFVRSKLEDLAQYLKEVREIFNSDKSGKVYMR
ncbi:hypothetical protein UA08_01015 [Talaromyces atroroseus]|uniref:Aminoglycoside phosphotransferase domain-containing protein n=1 Tax=Talaromyces atroroseus TaxID=1441469 RepID=A0A225AVG9_TALAT|nr:hypothetical protein UA08_01015 [Talaromyces atroroseus]OKL63613.1 hypothetical protein UA08_01015 [Talaromyces atroroseus]